MTQAEIRQQALSRAVEGQSMANFPAIYAGFAAKGIPETGILPRVNVFSFNAWKALGRYVKKGEHGVKIATVRTVTKKVRDASTGEVEERAFNSPWFVTVFHITQTEKCDGGQ